MGEEKPHRLLPVQQPFLVLHDQVVGVAVVGCPLLFVAELAVHHASAFLVDREIPGVGISGFDGIEVLPVSFIATLPLEAADDLPVFLLKDIGVLAVESPLALVPLVLCNLVDEEQGQHFDPFVKKLPLPFDVGENGLPYLYPAQLFFGYLADDIARKELLSVGKLQGAVAPVDAPDGVAVPVLLQAAGLFKEVEALVHSAASLSNA